MGVSVMEITDDKVIDILKNNLGYDQLDFGIIGFDNDKIIKEYNTYECEESGYEKDDVMNRNLFTEVAPCMNNYLVALKFEENEDLDESLPYILSFKVKPTPVDLRLLKSKELKYNYILIKRR